MFLIKDFTSLLQKKLLLKIYPPTNFYFLEPYLYGGFQSGLSRQWLKVGEL